MAKIEGREYSAEELSSMIVNKMKKVAEDIAWRAGKILGEEN